MEMALASRIIFKNYNCRNLRLFSSTNLAREIKQINQIQSVKDPKCETITSSNPSNFNYSKYSKQILNFIQSKSLSTLNNLNSFLIGPLRSNLLISFELAKLVAKEQKLFPAISDWSEAKSSYRNQFESVRSLLRDREKLKWMAGEMTWGQVGRFVRVLGEMAAFYYIGELFGMIIILPFK